MTDYDDAQSGGKILGEGGFGCVIKPGFTCKGNQMKGNNFITKIQVKNSTAETELNIGKLVKQIPFYKKRFAPVISSCNYNSKIVKMVSRKEQCNIVSRKPNKKFIISKVPYIEGDEFKKYLLKNVNENMFYTIIHSYIYLLYSIFLLNKQGVIHYDIKGENIMYDSKKKNPIIIDFGLSIIKKDIMPAFNDLDYKNRLSNYFYVYAPDYSLWCLDIHYISFLIKENKNDVKNEIPYMVEDYIKNNKLFNKMSIAFTERFKELSIKQLYKYEEMGEKAAISYIIKYCDSWDIYSLSIMFLRFFDLLGSENTEYEGFLKVFEMILSINIHPDPSQRLTSLETYNYLLEYIKTISPKNRNEINKIISSISENASNIENKLKKEIRYDSAMSHKISIFKQNRD